MVKSLRVRLQLWYGAIVLAALAIFAGLVYGHAYQEMHRRVEEQLTGAANYFDAVLRSFPPALLDSPVATEEKPGAVLGPSLASQFPGQRLLHDLQFHGGLARELELHPRDRPFYVVWRKDGSLLAASDEETERRFADYVLPALTEHISFEHHRGEAFALLLGPRGTEIMVGKPVNHEFALLHGFALHLALIGSAILAVAVLGGWWVSSRIVRPIASIAETAAKLSAATLGERIDTPNLVSELQPLAKVLNESLDRLQLSFAQLTQFTADASHELRTPLAVLQTQLELAASRPRTVEEYQHTLATCLRATERMRSLVDSLLLLARADAGRLELTKKPVNLNRVAEEAVEQIRPLADAASVTIACHLPAESIFVAGDLPLLTRVAANLLANAVQHSPTGSAVEISIRTEEDKSTGKSRTARRHRSRQRHSAREAAASLRAILPRRSVAQPAIGWERAGTLDLQKHRRRA
jgi:two-component system, OmpR family, sensor kinase